MDKKEAVPEISGQELQKMDVLSEQIKELKEKYENVQTRERILWLAIMVYMMMQPIVLLLALS